MSAMKPLSSSFRDPSGFMFQKDGQLFRSVHKSYQEHYDMLMQSGLYEALTAKELLIPHGEIDFDQSAFPQQYRLLKPSLIPFISYPYEWSFSQYKDAALRTLAIQKIALGKGMTLKDASAYNVQFHKGKAVFIDTLSFEKYETGQPWIAYGQFCRHFLAPLALMAYHHPQMGGMMRQHIDGIPLDIASSLLPFKSRFRMPLFLHIHLHAGSQRKHANTGKKANTTGKFSHAAFMGLLQSLEKGIKKLQLKTSRTEWGKYYEETILSQAYLNEKQELVRQFLSDIQSKSVWDLGANDGTFSRIAAEKAYTVSFDIDHLAVDYNYQQVRQNKEQNILPLQLDLTNPSPAIGWNNEERDSIFQRKRPDTVMALALIHHLAISNNLPLDKLADFFAGLCKQLIIEFVPKSDPRVQTLLATRQDIFPNYTVEGFEQAFSQYFSIQKKTQVGETDRILYLLKHS